MKIVNETTKINKKKSEARTAHVQMTALIIALALVSFAGGYYCAAAQFAQMVLVNKKIEEK